MRILSRYFITTSVEQTMLDKGLLCYHRCHHPNSNHATKIARRCQCSKKRRSYTSRMPWLNTDEISQHYVIASIMRISPVQSSCHLQLQYLQPNPRSESARRKHAHLLQNSDNHQRILGPVRFRPMCGMHHR